jgi:SAM-dependent methyltransferase
MPAAIDPQQYWEDRLTEHFNDRGVGDIGLPESYNRFLYNVRRTVFRRAARLAGINAERSKVLDVGSGTGFYIHNWLDIGVKDLTGSDITQFAVDQLGRKYAKVVFRQLDIGNTTVPWPSGTFDCVSSFDVLFHIVEDERFVAAIHNIAGLLKPGGVFLFSDNLVHESFNVRHQVGRTEDTILKTLDQAGLTVEYRIPMFVLMNDPVRSRSRLVKKAFSLIYRYASKSSLMGTLIGGSLYPFELLLTKLLKNGPSTEVLVCRREPCPT